MAKRERNYGIDLLRAISMCFIIMLHFLGHGGVLTSSTKGSVNWYIAYFLETIAYSGVCIFATISGYVGFSEEKKEHRLSSFLTLWFQVAFYSIIVSLIFYIFSSEAIDMKGLAKSFIPIASDAYWYFTAYFLVYLIAPSLNKLISNSDEKTIWIVLISGAIFMYFAHALKGLFGFSVLTLCYLIGAGMRKYLIVDKLNGQRVGMALFTMLTITWLCKVGIGQVNDTIGGLLLRYDSPTIILSAACFLILFAKKKIPSRMQTGVTLMATSAFAAYLLNDHPLIRERIISGRLAFFSDSSCFILVIVIVGGAAAFFIAAVLIDKIRIAIFRILHINEVSLMLEKMYEKGAIRLGEVAMRIGSKLTKS